MRRQRRAMPIWTPTRYAVKPSRKQQCVVNGLVRRGALEISLPNGARVSVDADGQVDLAEALRSIAVRGITRVFSEGGPRVAARLIALGLADAVVLITAEKPLGRPGVPALGEEARAALADGSRYRLHETTAYGADTMRVWERTE